MYRLLVFCVYIFGFHGFNIDDINVKTIQINRKNSYFGFNVVLQKGRQSAVIVAAPGNNSNDAGGTVHYCTLEDEKCVDYILPGQTQQLPRSFTGNFVGASMDSGDNVGEPLIVCSPRVVRNDYYLRGYCFLEKNSSSFNAKTYDINPFEYKPSAYYGDYYDYGFAELGMDTHYVKSENRVLIGAPGVKNWNGIFIAQSLLRLRTYYEIPSRKTATRTENFSYLGYKVTSARLEATRKRVWYIAGSPRGSELFGTVNIYEASGLPYIRIKGLEMGAYFGSSILAVDINHDNVDDLLIGAPMGKGRTWEEGYVHFYRYHRGKFENPILLTGSKKVGGRFGTCISSLGDIDLDSYNDVAISAPFEDDGVGAVYIYRGSKNGLTDLYSQRISPIKFSPNGNVRIVRGFGQGLSRGVDIDGNGYNDLAVGAYKSDQVFIVKTMGIIDFQLTLESNVSSITSDVINVRYCIMYTQRSQTRNIKNIGFKADLFFDYRTEGTTHITKNLTVPVSMNYCEDINLKIKKTPWDLSVYKIAFKTEIQQKDLIAKGEERVEKQIPFSHGCGSDNVCQTKILVDAVVPLKEIVIGKHKEFTATVSASNVGEPGYNCKLNLKFPSAIQLKDDKYCGLDGNTYACPFGVLLTDAMKEVEISFYIKLRDPEVDTINLDFEVKCLGENDPAQPPTNKAHVTLNVLLENSPYIQGSSGSESLYINEENGNDVVISHVFKVDNAGPSPVKLGVFLLLPIIQGGGYDIFVPEAKGSLNGIQISCNPTNKTVENDGPYEIQSYTEASLKNTVFINCSQEGIQCAEIFCDGEYLYKSTEIAEITVNINVRTHLLAELYHDEIERNKILAYASTAYLYNSAKERVRGHAATQIFGSSKKPVPLWIYIVGSTIGVLLLALLIFVLYKCHFFDRNYKERLKEEKLMDQRMDEERDCTEIIEESDISEDNSCQQTKAASQ